MDPIPLIAYIDIYEHISLYLHNIKNDALIEKLQEQCVSHTHIIIYACIHA